MAVASGLPESEGDKFWHHYTANGWKVGSAKMKSAESAMYMWASRKKEGKYDDNRNGAGRHGQLTPAERRNAVIAGADAIQQQAIRTAQREAEMVARGELPL